MNISFKLDHNETAPIYLQLKNQIENFIKLENLKPDTQLPDLKTLSAYSGVSIRTVDQALQELIKDGICYRKPKKGTYVAGKSTPAPTLSLAALCLPGGAEKTIEENIVVSSIYEGIRKKAAGLGSDVLLFSDECTERLNFYDSMAPSINLSGVILSESMPLDKAEELASRHPHKKLVYINYYFPNFEETRENIYGVFNDDFGGAYQIADYFATKGSAKFAICSLLLKDMNYKFRVEGFKAALEGHGIRVPENLIACPPLSKITTLFKHGYDSAAKFTNTSKNIPEVILCVNDEMAKGAAAFVKEHKLGKHVTVTGYDGILYKKIDGVAGTVKINFESIGGKAFDIIMNTATTYPKVIKIPANLMIS